MADDTTIRLWGRISSLNVRKAVWAAQELGLDFQRTDAGAAYGVTTTPEYQAKNPNGLVPLLEIGDFTLWESNAIVRYLCARYGDTEHNFYPTELEPRFDAERWMDWQQTTFNRAGGPAFLQLVRTAVEARNADVIQQSVSATEPLLALLDAHLQQHAYMGGETFGMADIPLGCEMHRWWGMRTAQFDACGVTRQELQDFPNVQRWFGQLQQRPASRGVLDVTLS
ncbi:MAG: glutathione S-transferase [Pseudomonadota bacterium]